MQQIDFIIVRTLSIPNTVIKILATSRTMCCDAFDYCWYLTALRKYSFLSLVL